MHLYMLVITNGVPLTNAAMWAGIVGFLSPLVIQYATKWTANSQIQAGVAFIFCLVAAAGTAYFAPNSSLSLHNWVQSALLVFTLAMASYEGFWKPTGATPKTTSTSNLAQ